MKTKTQPMKKASIEGELYEIFLNVDKAEFALRQVLKVRQSEKSKKAQKLLSEAHRLMEDDHQEWCEELGLE